MIKVKQLITPNSEVIKKNITHLSLKIPDKIITPASYGEYIQMQTAKIPEYLGEFVNIIG